MSPPGGETAQRGSGNPIEPPQTKRHKHSFTALFWHFGKYGVQGVHVHSCFTDGCNRVLIGEGRKCSGDPADHHRETLG